MSTQQPLRVSGRFNEIIGSHPCVFDDAPVAQEMAQRKYFKLPTDTDSVAEKNEQPAPVFTWERKPKQPKAKPQGYRYFVIPTDNEDK